MLGIVSPRYLCIAGLLLNLTLAASAFAYCDNCGGDKSCCPCPSGQWQCLYPHTSCEQACGLGSSASREAEIAAQMQAEEARRFTIELDAALRAGKEEQQRAVRRANERGIDAFKKHQWNLAVQYFEGALALAPSDGLIMDNLRQAREEQAAERTRREAEQKKRVSDLRLPPPPSPVARQLATTTLVIVPPAPSTARSMAANPEAWRNSVPVFDITQKLEEGRRAYREAVPLLPDFLRSATFTVMAGKIGHGAETLLEWSESIEEYREIQVGYRRLSEELVDRVATEVFTGVDQSTEGANAVTQFAAEGTQNALWRKVKEWGAHQLPKEPSQ